MLLFVVERWNVETAIKFPLFNRKKTKFNEVNRFLRSQTGDYTMKITGSGVCDRMQYINPKVYIDMNDGVIMEMYNNIEEMETFKGFHVFATDGSYVEIPDHPQAREEKWEFHQIIKLKLCCKCKNLMHSRYKNGLRNIINN